MLRFWRTAVFLAAAGLALPLASCAGDDPALPATASPPAAAPSSGAASASPRGPTPQVPPTDPAGSATPAWPPSGPDLVLRRTGGFAGVDQSVVVTPEGRWTYSDRRGGKLERGRLPDADLDELRRLLAGTGLAREAGAKPPPATCADGFMNAVSFGELTVVWSDCGGSGEPRTAAAIAELVQSRTAF